MNIFRFAGDMTHLASVLVLLLKIHTIKSCAGISLKTQELYALVFATRYLDLFTDYISLYNTLMKLIFLGSSFSIVCPIDKREVYLQRGDVDIFIVLGSCRHSSPAGLAAKNKNIDNLTGQYVFLLGGEQLQSLLGTGDDA
ncbi:UNVERIFIED_CONTAM: ER lumen protein-retaining receptor [Sesamum latifolium]|uniref:ER lumen protein-retaining receptor n=1 Tax=Sesamum latifolium TaxID=2727402 RepID=A0AAW2XRY2_9LAMI